MTTPILRFTKGPRYLDLQSGRYRVMPNWAPPAVSEIPLIADGTSANRSGAILVDRRPANRQITLPVNVLGSTSADIRRGIADLQTFLSMSGDESEPLYLEFLPNSDMPEPVWGNYGVYLRYQVISGSIDIASSYLSGVRLAADVDVVLTMVIKPYAVGRQQRLASALGGIIEDTLGAADGASRGLIVPEATTNKATNPVFGHATWDNGWVTGPQLISEKNTDPRFILFGLASGRLTCITAGTRTFCQSINVGNTNTHMLSMYAKRQDGAAVTSADCQLVYNVLLTTTYTAVGDGWYRLTASAAGINAATASGIAVAPAASIYADGFQIEELAYATPLAYGDLLGCAWTGTAHASTSTRAVGRARLAIAADTFSIGAGAVRVVWRAPYANTHGGSNLFLWSCGAATLRAYYQVSDDKFYFTDGTTSISTAAQTFVAGDVIVLHFVWGLAGLVIYKNGSSAASNGTYTPPAVPTYMYIGSSDTPNAQGYGPFMDFAIFGQAPTAAQVLADYTGVTPLTTALQRVGAIPWLWTKDGDDVVDNCDDSSRDNWAAAGGIPGGAEAETVVSLTNTNSNGLVYLVRGGLPYALFGYPTAPLFWAEHSGTVDGNSSGGQYNAIASLDNASVTAGDYRQFLGQQINFFTRGRPVGDTSLTGGILVGSAILAYANLKPASSANYNLYYLGSVVVGPQTILGIDILAPTVAIRLQNTGSTYNSDFLLAAIGDVTRVDTSGWDFVLRGNRAKVSAAGALGADLPVLGKAFVLQPDKLNMIWSLMAAAVNGAMTITHTATFASIKVRPLYPLL